MNKHPAHDISDPCWHRGLLRWFNNHGDKTDFDSVEVISIERLTGGAIQENWLISILVKEQEDLWPSSHDWLTLGRHHLVLRTEGASSISFSHSKAQEYAIAQCAYDHGVLTPKPLYLEASGQVIGKPFALYQYIKGTASPYQVTDHTQFDHHQLNTAHRLAGELAKIHQIKIDHTQLDQIQTADDFSTELNSMEAALSDMKIYRPALAWAMRWLKLNQPAPLTKTQCSLVHNDFRTGNLMFTPDTGLSGILDWEFATWGDPHMDLGWFCASCWRYLQPKLEAGGLTESKEFLTEYQNQAQLNINLDRLFWWQVFAHLRWAVIALEQSRRFTHHHTWDLDLALVAFRLPELEFQLLDMLPPSRWVAQVAHDTSIPPFAINDAPPLDMLQSQLDRSLSEINAQQHEEKKISALMIERARQIIDKITKRQDHKDNSSESPNNLIKIISNIENGRFDGSAIFHTQMLNDIEIRLEFGKPTIIELLTQEIDHAEK